MQISLHGSVLSPGSSYIQSQLTYIATWISCCHSHVGIMLACSIWHQILLVSIKSVDVMHCIFTG